MSIGKEEYRFAHQNIAMTYQLLSALPPTAMWASIVSSAAYFTNITP